MRNIKNFLLIYPVIAVILVLTNLGIAAHAQPTDTADHRKKNFGSSLKKNGRQKKNEPEIKKPTGELVPKDDVIRIETTLVLNDILVFDKDKNVINGLRKEDFVVREDGKTQEIEAFSTGDSERFPRSIVLIIDYSGSQLPYIETSIEAAKILVEKLNPEDQLAIVTDNVELIQDFTRDKNLLKEKLEALKQDALTGKVGKSRQYCALLAVLNEMFNEEHLRPIIILQSDGDELARLNTYSSNLLRQDFEAINFTFKDILTAIEKKRAVIYTIVPGIKFLGISKKERLVRAKLGWLNNESAVAGLRNMIFNPNSVKLDDDALDQWAEERLRQQTAIAEIAAFAGGTTDFLEQPEQAETIYTQILSGMKRRYIIGYYPTNQARDGKEREVKIEVRGRSGYSVWGRKSYILPEQNK